MLQCIDSERGSLHSLVVFSHTRIIVAAVQRGHDSYRGRQTNTAWLSLRTWTWTSFWNWRPCVIDVSLLFSISNIHFLWFNDKLRGDIRKIQMFWRQATKRKLMCSIKTNRIYCREWPFQIVCCLPVDSMYFQCSGWHESETEMVNNLVSSVGKRELRFRG